MAAVFAALQHWIGSASNFLRITCSTTILEESLNDLHQRMTMLVALKKDVDEEVSVSRHRGLILRDQVENWLYKVDNMANEAEKLVREGNQLLEKNCLGRNCWSTYQLEKKMARTRDEAAHLMENRMLTEQQVAYKFPVPQILEIPRDDTVGLDMPFQIVWDCLNDEQCGVIGLYGTGGIGKTTLLMKIHNALGQRRNNFDIVIWVTVSSNFSEERIQDSILMNLQMADQLINGKASTISAALKEKRFVLLLDDVWETIDMSRLGVPQLAHDQNKSKLVFTTRSREVCSSMKVNKVISLQLLSPKDSWFLFKMKVGEDTINSHTEIEDLASEVVDKCGGLPLALVTMGSMMRQVTTPQLWHCALQKLRHPTAEYSQLRHLFSIIKLSYDNLTTEATRKCFIHCSLFPAESPIEKNQLIDYWIGEGFLRGSGDQRDSRKMGYDVIRELVSASLLQDGENFVKMHPLIHDTALWIASDYGKKKNNFLVQTGVQLAKLPKLLNWEEAEKVSLTDNSIEVLDDAIPPCPNLSTMILSKNALYFISNDFFASMPVLRVLDLSWSMMEDLPMSISDLITLHYLNLSHTNISRLPESIGKLVNLEVFDLSYTVELIVFPSGVIPQLSNLQTLNLFYCGHANWTEESDDLFIGTKSFLEELERLSPLNDLGLSIVGEPALNKLQSSPKLQLCTRSLSIVQCQGLVSLPLEYIQFMKYLDTLEVHKCHDLKEFMIDQLGGKDKISDMVIRQAYFDNLKHVTIEDCWLLEELTWLSFAANLQSLEIDKCMNLKEIISVRVSGASDIEENPGTFSRLKRLYLGYLPELRLISRIVLHLTELEEITVVFCPKLRNLPIDSESGLESLKMIKGHKNWWDELEWEHKYMERVFFSYFTETEL